MQNQTAIIESDKITVDFKCRLNSDILHIKEEILKNTLGAIHIVKITNRQLHKITQQNPFIYNLEDFDLARFLTGQEVTEVFAMTTAENISTVITLKMTEGALVIIDFSTSNMHGSDQRIEVFGSKGAMLIDNISDKSHTLFHQAYQPNSDDFLSAMRIAESAQQSVIKNMPIKLIQE